MHACFYFVGAASRGDTAKGLEDMQKPSEFLSTEGGTGRQVWMGSAEQQATGVARGWENLGRKQ